MELEDKQNNRSRFMQMLRAIFAVAFLLIGMIAFVQGIYLSYLGVSAPSGGGPSDLSFLGYTFGVPMFFAGIIFLFIGSRLLKN